MVSDSSSKPYVIYVPGFRSADDPQDKAIQILQTIYPNATEVSNFSWENFNSNVISNTLISIIRSLPPSIALLGDTALHSFLSKFGFGAIDFVTQWGSISERWKKALHDVVPTAQNLANRIASLTPEKQKNVILVGHSLGANIVVRALVHLYRRGITIHQAVLLGAAMDNDDPQIQTAINTTVNPIYSMVNPDDLALFIYQQVEGSQALGTGCALDFDPLRLIERYVPTNLLKTGGHASDLYLTQWARVCGVPEESIAKALSVTISAEEMSNLLSDLPDKSKEAIMLSLMNIKKD